MFAQNDSYLTGSYETNTNYYVKDTKTGAAIKDDRFGSNNYLKLDYYTGKFSAGLQMEGYLPAVVGYPTELKKLDLSNLYVSWKDDNFSVTAGTFYDQFGSGLLFRSWEDRALGLNNAVIGARFTYNYKGIVALKAIWGMPRFGMGITNFGSKTGKELETQVRGADISFNLSELLDWNELFLSIEASGINKFEPISTDLMSEGGKPNRFGYSARANFEYQGFFAKGEYVDAGKKYYNNPDFTSNDWFLKKKGNAQLIEIGYNKRGLGVTLTGRRLEWMDNQIIAGEPSTSNMINYVPAMCTQYTYLLTTLHPYSSQTGMAIGNFINSGELGGQLDAFYNFRRGTAIGGKRGMKVHANFSTYYTIAKERTFRPGNLLFRDFSFDVEKQWTKQFKMVLLYSMQHYNHTYGSQAIKTGADKSFYNSNIFVADLLYKYTSTFSTRLELQYLQTKDDQKDWMAALLEVNFAPHWSIFASDMFNHGSTRLNYYNGGVSYSKSRTRTALGYGRYKAGYICSGGVCRSIPAYTGANLSITTSF
jgi:hypothetical protein